ncbi:DUF58 domain-containing protein [Conexibacter sp. SYSU D00693]|uniref:DUF58 domain-containing protein n=1 Tax=Conexibacter sp. SYSU D00693 TaxID=2812560 RepID=UPI00196A8869|nr:DUF58 domain-containing protein [Conexibacter sp. SYSU D00693]
MSGGEPALELVPPAAAQGPGPLPPAVVDRLALVLSRRVAGLVTGEARAFGLGTGTELEQLRPYQDGDDVRRLDPAATARTGVPHVRLHVPERALSTWLVVDVSPSMAFGTAERLKADVAAGAARVLGDVALRHAGRLAVVACGGAEPRVLPARGGREALAGLLQLLDAGVVPDGAGRADALGDALRRVAVRARRPGLVCVVSDFAQPAALRAPLAALARRHALLAVEVRDPRELELPVRGRLAVVDPETGEHHEVLVDDGVRERFAAAAAAERREVADLLRALGASHVALDTDGQWLTALGRGLA